MPAPVKPLKLVLATVLVVSGFLIGRDRPAANSPLIVHEWGTFTSVAGKDGAAVSWAPLSGTPDLPCFVDQLAPQNVKLMPGLVRMETPVVYFYAERPLIASVQVRFPEGWVTEWFPHAARVRPGPPKPGVYSAFGSGQIDWEDIRVGPGESASLPSSQGPSRYYAARNTDSMLLAAGADREKFLFYRGVGNFRVPLEPRFCATGKISLRNRYAETIPLAIVFENRGGTIGYRFVPNIAGAMEVDSPELTGTLSALQNRMVESLIEFGLYRKEAAAMVDTWRDSWFEEGTRVFYITPRLTVDSVLPIAVTPHPSTLSRVFMGRVEMMAPWAQRAIATALENGDIATLVQFNRFLDPFLAQAGLLDPAHWSATAQRYVNEAHMSMAQNRASENCVK